MKKYKIIEKFLDALKVDLRKDVCYGGRRYGEYRCVCGHRINRAYLFYNQSNNLKCYVGVDCLQYIADYLGWNDKK